MPAYAALRLLLAAAIALSAAASQAHPLPHAPAAVRPGPPAAPGNGADQVVDDFHAALERGDAAAAAHDLADAIVVFESGFIERSKAEYVGHHLAADAVFAQAVGAKMTRRSRGGMGDLAWIASEGRTQGRYKDRAIDKITTETMVLQRTAGVWKIVHVHWSSRDAATAP